ncbi:MAG: patatin-like phospholipase family protein [Pseudomonadota bacterium]
MTAKKALVIGCGGVAGGAWTTAMLAAYAEATGHDPRTFDIIMGTSSGSVMTALLGGGIGVDELLAAQRQPVVNLAGGEWRHGGAAPPLPRAQWPAAGLVKLGLQGKVSALTALSGLLPQGREDLTPMIRMVEGVCRGKDWVDHPNAWVMAVDAQSGERVAFGSESAPPCRMADAVRASYAVPGWCPAVNIGGRDYIDGGVVSPTSADLLIGRDVEEVIIVPPMVSRKLDHPRHPFTKVERLLRKTMTNQVNREERALKRAGIRVARLEPTVDDLNAFGYNMMDPARRRQVFETALKTSPGVVRAAGLGA